jgi:glycosyltransferase involved in cell wall biosynthesis
LLEKVCANFTSKIIVVSDFDKDFGLERLIGKENQYIVIRYSINCRNFENSQKRSAAKSSLGLNDNDLAIGMVACFKPQKSIPDFIKLASAIKKDFPHAKFILAGDGLLQNKARALIKKLNLEGQVILAGWRNDIPLILSALDIFVLTSLWEGLPVTVLEAMAAGVPVVATDTGGIREVIEDGKTGYLVAVRDMQSMKNRVEGLLRDAQKRDAFVKLSRERISSEKFLLSNMLKDTQGLYFNLWEGFENA